MSGELSRLEAPEGANKRKLRVGRGYAAGGGKTAGRGQKGQKARKSGGVRPGFEGGQMPLHRRLAKRGFKNPFPNDWAVVRLGDLNRFEPNSTVDYAALKKMGLTKGKVPGIKIIANGELKHPLTVRVNRITESAKSLVEKAGGTVELIKDRTVWKRIDARAERRAAKKK